MYGLLLLYRLYHNSRRAPHQTTNSDTESDSPKDRVLSYPRKRLVKDPEFWKFVGTFFGLLLLDSLFWGLPIILIAGGYYEYLARLHDAAAHIEKRYYSSKAMIELHVSELEWSNPMTAREIPRITCADNGAYCGASLSLIQLD